MRLTIIRHGKASDLPCPAPEFPRPDGLPADFDRQLTPRGCAQALYLAGQLADIRPFPELILSSPYARAIKTALTINSSIHAVLTIAHELEVDHSVSEVLSLIEQHAHIHSLVLVGHNPQLGELLSILSPALAPEEMVFKTGEAVVFDINPMHAVGSAKAVARLRLHDEASIMLAGACGQSAQS